MKQTLYIAARLRTLGLHWRDAHVLALALECAKNDKSLKAKLGPYGTEALERAMESLVEPLSK